MKWLIILLIILWPTMCLADGMSQGAAMYTDKTKGLDQGAHQQSVAAAAPAAPSGAPTGNIINVTQFFCDEVYSWKMIG